jgi:dihydropteroate synthase
MGVVNVTPDSFFDGGRYAAAEEARARVDAVIEAGALIVDIGGESTRPGALPVSASSQIDRIGVAIEHAASRGTVVSVDTTSPEVAEFALRRGARIVNDVSRLADPELASVAARHDAALVITHSRGPQERMPGFSKWSDQDYPDVVSDVRRELDAAASEARRRGVRPEYIWPDPGLGFSKNARQSFELLRRLREVAESGAIIVVGPGRKSFISSVDPSTPEDRLGGTIAACLVAVDNGASILRVHDVREVRQALAVARAARLAPPEESLGAAQ